MKYRIYINFMSSYYVGDIEADSKEDAENRAEEASMCDLDNIPELTADFAEPYITGIVAERVESDDNEM